MEQYELLWQYQQVDMELDQYEKEMRGNSNRKELIKHRDFLKEQQEVLKIRREFQIALNSWICTDQPPVRACFRIFDESPFCIEPI